MFTTTSAAKSLFIANWLIFFLFILLPHQHLHAQCAVQPAIYPKMGVNLSGLAYWNSERYFTDLAKESNLRFFKGPQKGRDYDSTLNESGWPKASFQMVIAAGDNRAIKGNYKIRYKGAIATLITAFNLSVSNKIFSNGYTTMDMALNNDGNCILEFNAEVAELKIIPISLSGVPTGFTIDNYQTFNPKIINDLKSFTNLRFMDWGNTNGNLNGLWSKRTPRGGWQAKGTGVSYEHMIEYCNTMNKDMWVNIPINADDDYITNLATLIRDSLRTDRNVHVEYGNEIWNYGGGFYCFGANVLATHKEVKAEGDATAELRGTVAAGDYISTSQENVGTIVGNNVNGFNAYSLMIRKIGKRCKEISVIFGNVWGAAEINNRVRIILAGQQGYGGKGHGFNIDADLRFINAHYGPPKNFFYAIAGAPYFNIDPSKNPDNSANTAVINNKNVMLDHMNMNVDTMFLSHVQGGGNQIEGWAGKARYYGLRYVAYEGGPDLDYTTGWTIAKRDAKRDGRMKDIAAKYWNYWYGYGDDGLFNLFSGGYSADYQGVYAWKEFAGDDSPLSQAVDLISQTPTPALAAGNTIPGLVDARKVYGWESCGDIFPCAYGNVVGPEMDGKLYLHQGGEISYLLSSNSNSTYKFEIYRDCYLNSSGEIWLDGSFYGNYSFPNTSGRQWQTVVVNGNSFIPINYGSHVVTLKFTSENCNFYQYRFTAQVALPPAIPVKPQGRIAICNGGEAAIKYSVPSDGSVCKYEWSITGSNTQLVGVANTNEIVLNYLAGFTSTGIYVRAYTTAGGYSNWSIPITVGSINCGFQASPLVSCYGNTVNVIDNSGVATTWDWDFGDANATVTGANTSAPGVLFSGFGLKTIKLTIDKGLISEKKFAKFDYINQLPNVSGANPIFAKGTTSSICQGAASIPYNATIASGIVNYSLAPSYAGTINITTGKVGWSGSFYGVATVTAIVPPSSCGSTVPGTAFHTIVVNSTTPVGINIESNVSGTVCTGTGFSFTATGSNITGTPIYKFIRNNIIVQNGLANIYNSNTLVHNDVIKVVMSTSGVCNANIVSSTGIAISLSPFTNPSVSIVALATTICSNVVASFTGVIINGGASPSYDWSVNGVSQGVNNTVFTSSSLANNAIIGLVITSTSICASKYTATATGVGITIVSPQTPTVSISATLTTICSNQAATFTGIATNVGNFPAYTWKVNGSNRAFNNTTFILANATQNDNVVLYVSANPQCSAPVVLTSNGINVTITPTNVIGVAISTSGANVCEGITPIFQAIPANGGSNPVYQWRVNGNNVGTNSNIYEYSSPSNAARVDVVMVSNAVCKNTGTIASNGVVVTVNSTVTPTVTLVSSATTVCSGIEVSFKATATYGGNAPIFSFYLNDAVVQSTIANTYINTTIINDNMVKVVVNSDRNCITVATATSNIVAVKARTDQAVMPMPINWIKKSCANANVMLSLLPTGKRYLWSVSGGTFSVSSDYNTANITVTNSSILTVAATDTTGCNSDQTYTGTIDIKHKLATPIFTTSYPNMCVGQSKSFQIESLGELVDYTWKSNDNVVLVANNTTKADIKAETVGDTFVKVYAKDDCSTSDSLVLPINIGILPSENTIVGSTLACTDVNINYSLVNNDAVGYNWHVPINAAAVGSLNANNIDVNFNKVGTYTVNVDAVYACGVVNYVMKNINVSSIPEIPAIEVGRNELCKDEEATFKLKPSSLPSLFTISATNDINLVDTTQLSKDNSFIIKANNFPSSNTTMLMVKAVNYCGTSSILSYKLNRFYDCGQKIFVSNVITPNSAVDVEANWNMEGLDGYGSGDIAVKVYNKAGAIVYESHDHKAKWNGKDNAGRFLSTGVYYYLMEISKTGKKITGYVTIIY